MCGINGVISDQKISNLAEIVSSMNEKLLHRGPDGKGVWINEAQNIGLGHTRLSILDLSNLGSQPMQSSSSRYVITFNGEIYNFLELKINHNISCKGNSDTEVLIELIEKYGINETLKLIDGMFSFAIWDKSKNKLTISRDRFGEKPLYYGWIGKKFVFSSDLEPFYEFSDWSKEIDKEALFFYQSDGYIPSPKSIFKDIKKLNPGHYLELNLNQLNKRLAKEKKFWDLEDIFFKPEEKMTFAESKQHFEKLLNNSVKQRMVSDVPIGAFLSGGTDSSLIVSLMQKNSTKPINTFTIGTKSKKFNEANQARKVSEFLNTNHSELYIDEKEIINLSSTIFKTYGEPFADSSQIPTYLVSKLASKSVKVVLSGDAGDELFGGYKRYLAAKDIWLINKYLPKSARNYVSKLFRIDRYKNKINFILNRGIISKYANASNKLNKGDRFMKLITEDSFESFYRLLISINIGENYLNNDFQEDYSKKRNSNSILKEAIFFDLKHYLPDDILTKVDRASMHHSLEVRSPFLSKELVEWSCSIPLKYKISRSSQKIIPKKVLQKYLRKENIYREKKGFAVPISDWLNGPLKEMTEDILNSESFLESEFWNTKKVKDIWESHKKGTSDNGRLIWSIINFEKWKNSTKQYMK